MKYANLRICGLNIHHTHSYEHVRSNMYLYSFTSVYPETQELIVSRVLRLLMSTEIRHGVQSIDMTYRVLIWRTEYWYDVQSIDMTYRVLIWHADYWYGVQSIDMVHRVLVWRTEYWYGAQSIDMTYRVLMWCTEYWYCVQSIDMTYRVLIWRNYMTHPLFLNLWIYWYEYATIQFNPTILSFRFILNKFKNIFRVL